MLWLVSSLPHIDWLFHHSESKVPMDLEEELENTVEVHMQEVVHSSMLGEESDCLGVDRNPDLGERRMLEVVETNKEEEDIVLHKQGPSQRLKMAAPPSYTITQDPFGNFYFGTPVTPVPAYEGQYLPPPYLFQPPPAFYAPPNQDSYQPPSNPIPPPAYYYGPPPAYEPPPYSPAPPQDPWAPWIPSDGKANLYVEEMKPTTAYAPTEELTADFSDNEYLATDQVFSGDSSRVTHLNYFSNYLERIVNLYRYPNLLRLTLRENNLESLHGISEAPYLRWLDVSNNYLETFQGMGNFPNLEWLDCTNNNIVNLTGISFAPNLSWLCCHHNHLKSLMGADTFTNLRWLDISSSDLKSVRGLEECKMLQEVNMANNNLTDVESVKALADLPYLFRIDIYKNDFSDAQVSEIVQHFKTKKPDAQVITTKEEAAAVGHNVEFSGKVWASKPGPNGSSCSCTLL
eukprot:TRINITY_DN10196_c1_g1_i1.p1 TRINITY_DN10196_c1_g1~~TRINITY_DN10196_c1_g1_i1.p1  ORF type:complete len:459 (-),score=100.82 TRINITY_DN10196_c1_g1_i1:126-1502(-)